MAGCAVLPISLFIFAWTSYEDISWVGPMMSGIPFGWSMVSIYVCLCVHLELILHRSFEYLMTRTLNHVDLGQRLHRRLLPEIRRLRHSSQDLHSLDGRRRRPDVRHPDVQQAEPALGQHAPCFCLNSDDADSICFHVVSTPYSHLLRSMVVWCA